MRLVHDFDGVIVVVAGVVRDADGVLHVVHETPIPPGMFPDNVTDGPRVSTYEQRWYVDGCKVMLKSRDGDVTGLDLSRDQWIIRIRLQVGAVEGSKRPSYDGKLVDVTCRVVSRESVSVLGRMREVIAVAQEFKSEEGETIPLGISYFVSGLGLLAGRPEQLVRIEYATGAPEAFLGPQPGTTYRYRAPGGAVMTLRGLFVKDGMLLVEEIVTYPGSAAPQGFPRALTDRYGLWVDGTRLMKRVFPLNGGTVDTILLDMAAGSWGNAIVLVDYAGFVLEDIR